MSDLIERLRGQLEQLKNEPTENNMRKTSERALNQVSGVTEFIIDLLTEVVFTNQATWNKTIKGYGVIFAEEGSTPGVRVNIGFGSFVNQPLRSFRAGDVYIGPFDQITLTRAIDAAKYSPTGEVDPRIGTIRLLVLTDPSAMYQSERSGDRNIAQIQDIKIGTAAWTELGTRQQTNVAAGGANAPNVSTCGALDINGARGMRFIFDIPAVITATPCFIRLWYNMPDLQGWILQVPHYKVSLVTGLPDAVNAGIMPYGDSGSGIINLQQAIGLTTFMTCDLPVACGMGKVYPECVFTTAAPQSITCQAYAWK